MTTKRASTEQRDSEMRAEYRFDYSKSRPNRFSDEMQDTLAVILEPDVAVAFKTSAAVNRELRRALKSRGSKKRAG